MDKNPELQKQAKTGEIAIKGTKEPDVTSEPVAPARVIPTVEKHEWEADIVRHRDLGDETDA